MVMRLYDTARRLGRVTLNPIKHLDPFLSVLLPALLIFTNSPFLFGAGKPVPVEPRTGTLCGNSDPANQAKALGQRNAIIASQGTGGGGQTMAFSGKSFLPGLPSLPSLPTVRS